MKSQTDRTVGFLKAATWVPSLYFAEGFPYVIVMSIAVVMYKRLGLDNGDIAFYTSWLYLPWVIKPFWGPIVDMFRTKRWWILIMQMFLGAALAGVAFTIPAASFVQWTLAFFWLMAFSSATHDIAADGFYMLALSEQEQSLYVGIRSTFYRIATIAGQGLLTMLAGTLETFTRNPSQAWSYTFWVAAGIFILLYAYHIFFIPRPKDDVMQDKLSPKSLLLLIGGALAGFFLTKLIVSLILPESLAGGDGIVGILGTFVYWLLKVVLLAAGTISAALGLCWLLRKEEMLLWIKPLYGSVMSFFAKPQIWVAVAFMLLYRLPEALLVKICPLFMLDSPGTGGLGLTTSEIGFVQGTVGVIGLTIGGILGGIVVAKDGFKRWLFPMVAAITLPDVVYILLAYYQPEGLLWVNICVFIEQFGYGFGFTAYMLYLIYFSQGENKTAHYAFCTGFMALSMMLPGMFAGELQESVGYLNFFIIAMCLTPLTFLVARFVRVDKDFGRKEN